MSPKRCPYLALKFESILNECCGIIMHRSKNIKGQDRRVLPYEKFPVLKDLKNESVTWGRFFLFVLICEKKKHN